MALFAVIAVVLTLAVLAIVLWPLWRDSRGVVLGAVAALGLATFALYHVVGTPTGINATAVAMIDTPAAGQPVTLEAAITELQAELKRNPQQPEGWRLLGKSLAAMQRFPESRDAFAKALALMPEEPDLLVETAQSRLYASADRKLDEQAVALLRRALAIKPDHQRALWFLGMSQRQNQQPAEAARTWESLLSQVDAGTASSLREQIDAARAEAGLPALPAAPAKTSSNNALTVKVALDPEFAARVRLPGDASVFVIARIPDGPPMPVAAEKHALQDLPLTLTLDDGDSPMPTQKLSQLKEVELIARVSASGNPMRQEGDLESKPVRVTLPASKPVELVLGQPTE